ncbi:MAG TPA: sodium:solute symporter family protein [Candidatus Acidoferrales bacterium]|nr:sodium:solute symporter family protein [Candidatus Acidoferrales bacterium]
MTLSTLDWLAIFGYLAVTLVLGLYFRSRSSRSVDDYFVSGRNVNWWLAGTSMVATTFSADTPLVVAGLVYTQGISGNWLWWGFLLSGMMTVFLFARLWRRSGLLTDVQFAEMRYSGKPAAFLRGFRAIYLGLLINCVILGWVTKAMTSIVSTTLGGSGLLQSIAHFGGQHLGAMWGTADGAALAVCVFILIPLTGLYVSLGGLWGVLWTDLFQFVLKMSIVIVIAWYSVAAVGGMQSLLAQLAAARVKAGPQAADPLSFFPSFSHGFGGQPLWSVPVTAFVVYVGLQWWAFWYPGSEPGGGGYIAQRIFSARNERHGLLSVLWFNIAQYAVRPWPWILTALAVIVLYPGLAHPETGYMLAMNQYLPHSLRGVAIAGFLAAFMSTVATQLNWGASYIVSDFYRRFIHRNASEHHYVIVSRLSTVLLVVASAWVSVNLSSIGKGWQLVMEIGAGTGAVYMLRWYWWRINAWSEISAMAASLVSAVTLFYVQPFHGTEPQVFAETALATTIFSTVVWVTVTLLTPPEPTSTLVEFYRKVRPDVRFWKPIARLASDVQPTRDIGSNLVNWVLGCAMVYLALFGTGKLILREPAAGLLLLMVSAISAGLLYKRIERGWTQDSAERASAAKPAL